jgi:serine/tyrosine/threonine adenylyltransferase
MSAATAFRFDNSYARDLPGFYTAWKPASVVAPRLLFLNRPLADELGLDPAALDSDEGAALFAGNRLPDGAEPLAQAYAGHQFGGFSPQLGDGRALLIGEMIDRHGQRRDIAFKGSGRTPFSRGGDGRAAIGPMLRELVVGEAMQALGIPTTRALAVAATGESVRRDQPLPGAVLTRVAASHLRVGTFQYFAARDEIDHVRQLADYAIARHDPALIGSPERYHGLLAAVADRQARLIAQWMNVGFIHGVMNTDNMTISGETIDYGPCAFLEAYDPRTVFSSIDHGGRYAYGNQPHIARWNLARLAETLLPLMDERPERAMELAMQVIDGFPAAYERRLRDGQRAKLGLQRADLPEAAADEALIDDWLALMQTHRLDFTLAWRSLGAVAAGDADAVRRLPAGPAADGAATDASAIEAWLARWQARCAAEDAAQGADAQAAAARARAARMQQVNPWVIARNHRVEEVLQAASEQGDLAPLRALLEALRSPFTEDPAQARWAEPAPAAVTASYQTFCGT